MKTATLKTIGWANIARYYALATTPPCPHTWGDWINGTDHCLRRSHTYPSDITYARDIVASIAIAMRAEGLA